MKQFKEQVNKTIGLNTKPDEAQLAILQTFLNNLSIGEYESLTFIDNPAEKIIEKYS